MTTWVAAMRDERYADAWALAGRALAARDPATRDDPTLPYHLRWVWGGCAVDGRDVLVRCYHGLGDTIQFARFLPLLAARAASVTLEVQPALIGILAGIAQGITMVPFDPARPLPPAEVDLEIAELAFALRVTPGDAVPRYLHAAPAALPPGTIGLCHSTGNWDTDRRLPAELLAPFCRIAPCITLVPEPTGLDVLNPEGCPSAITDTAALVAGVDLVVTVDTMIAHLAGAMGRPTWLLLKAAPDWRWAPDRPDSAWYPSLRLYIQPRAGDWEAVIDRIAHDLGARQASLKHSRDRLTCDSATSIAPRHSQHPDFEEMA